jgi:hypothetical protein
VKTHPIVLLSCLFVVACQSSQPAPVEDSPPAVSTANVTFSGGHGAGCDDAVVVHATNESEGIRAEYEWIGREYPGFQRGGQGLGDCKTAVDVIDITTREGEQKKIFFDISSFLGKW